RDREARVRLFYAEVESADETIKDGLESLATALVRAMQPPALPRPKLMLPPVPAAPAKEGESNPLGQNGQSADEDQVIDAELEDDGPLDVPAPRPKSSRVRKPREQGQYWPMLRPACPRRSRA